MNWDIVMLTRNSQNGEDKIDISPVYKVLVNGAAGAIRGGLITAALIIAMAMLGCTVIDYFTYRELPEAYEEPESGIVLSIPI